MSHGAFSIIHKYVEELKQLLDRLSDVSPGAYCPRTFTGVQCAGSPRLDHRWEMNVDIG
jgi:hypothetical protein